MLIHRLLAGEAPQLSTEEQHQFLGYADTLARQGVPQVSAGNFVWLELRHIILAAQRQSAAATGALQFTLGAEQPMPSTKGTTLCVGAVDAGPPDISTL